MPMVYGQVAQGQDQEELPELIHIDLGGDSSFAHDQQSAQVGSEWGNFAQVEMENEAAKPAHHRRLAQKRMEQY